jgi:hypothetical protein
VDAAVGTDRPEQALPGWVRSRKAVYRIEGKQWRESKWGPQIEATRTAFASAREAMAPLVAGGKLSKAEALSRIGAKLPADWDSILRGVVADELLAALQPYRTNDTDSADNG